MRRERGTFVDDGRRSGVVGPQRSVGQQRDLFRTGDRRAHALRVKKLRQGSDCQITTARELIGAADHRRVLDAHRPFRINFRAEFLVAENRAVRRVRAGRKRGSVDLRGAGINRMVLGKEHAGLRQGPEMGRVLLAHEVGPHPIPDHDNDRMADGSIGRGSGSRREQ